MLDYIINDLKANYNGLVPIEDAIKYIETAYDLGKDSVEEEFKFRRFEKEDINLFDEFKYIPNPYNGGDDDFIIVDMVDKEYTYGEYGDELFSSIIALNRDFGDYSLKELVGRSWKPFKK